MRGGGGCVGRRSNQEPKKKRGKSAGKNGGGGGATGGRARGKKASGKVTVLSKVGYAHVCAVAVALALAVAVVGTVVCVFVCLAAFCSPTIPCKLCFRLGVEARLCVCMFPCALAFLFFLLVSCGGYIFLRGAITVPCLLPVCRHSLCLSVLSTRVRV